MTVALEKADLLDELDITDLVICGIATDACGHVRMSSKPPLPHEHSPRRPCQPSGGRFGARKLHDQLRRVCGTFGRACITDINHG